MALRLDHVVILVDDLGRASADYGALGFTVVYGGEHADGVTENALVAFKDGSYLELIHFKRPAPGGHFFERGYKAGEGLIAYALVPEDIERTIAEARERGLELDGPRAGGRLRPDGTRLEWKIGTPRTPDLPFLCADVTPRELRVPGGKARRHKNHVTGIAQVTVAVRDIVGSLERYKVLLGEDPMYAPGEDGGSMRLAGFLLKDSFLALIEPSGGTALNSLRRRGEGPSWLYLGAPIPSDRAGDIDFTHTHGVGMTRETSRFGLRFHSYAEEVR